MFRMSRGVTLAGHRSPSCMLRSRGLKTRSNEYPNMGRALWFTLQTVTTVGYGDVTPESPIARVVAAVVMLVAIALITVLTALVTSTFIEAARSSRQASQDSDADAAAAARIEASLDALGERLDRIERTLGARDLPDPESTGHRPEQGGGKTPD